MAHAPSFAVTEPSAEETPVIVEVPHAGLFLDGEALASLAAPARSIGRDADLWVDELYSAAPAEGATLLVSRVSRYLVDLNRAETDVDPDAVFGVPLGVRAIRGVIWRVTSDGQKILDAPLKRTELERRLARYYRPYHEALAQAIERKKARFGFALVLAAHSMPSVSRAVASHGAHAAGDIRADVVPGSRGRTSAAAAFIDAVDRHARAGAMTVAHDDPYQGGFTTQHYGRPGERVHVVQVELARRLYMDEATLAKNAAFGRMASWCAELAGVLGRVKP